MNLLHWAGRSLGVRPGEGRSVALMTAHSFAMGASTVFFETAASALFLAQFDKTYLPWVYIAAALLNLGTGYAYASIKDRVSFARLMAGTLVFLLVSVVSVRVGLLFSGAAWLVFASLVWYRVLSILTDLEYWAVAARLYDVREAKRLFGLIGSGEVVARIAGAFSVPLLLRFMGVPNLILLSGAALALCLVLLLAVLPLLAARGDGEPAPRGRRAAARRSLPEQLREILSHPYLSLVVALAVLAVFGKYFVDFAFLEQMRARMSDAKELAGFFAIFSGVTQGLSLLTRVFVSGPVLTRLGVRVGMLVLPVTQTRASTRCSSTRSTTRRSRSSTSRCGATSASAPRSRSR
jgi:AAA family ATP:ADP antiporter